MSACYLYERVCVCVLWNSKRNFKYLLAMVCCFVVKEQNTATKSEVRLKHSVFILFFLQEFQLAVSKNCKRHAAVFVVKCECVLAGWVGVGRKKK